MRRLKTSTKLSVYYAVMIVLLIGGAVIAYYNYSRSSIHELGVNNLTQICDSVMGQLDNRLTNMEQVSVDVLSNNTFTTAWSRILDGNSTQESTIREILTKAFVNKGDIRRVSVFGENGLYYSTGISTATSESVSRRYADIQANYSMNHINSRIFLSPHLDNWHPESDGWVISEIKPIKDSQSVIIGYLEVQQNVLYINKICDQRWNKKPLQTVVFVNKDDLFYTNWPLENQKDIDYIDWITETTSVYSKVRETQSLIICTTGSNYYECKTVVILEKAMLYESMTGLAQGLVIGAALLVLATMGFILFITNRMMQPINQLVRRMENTDLDSLSEQPYYEVHSLESKVLITTFEKMRQRLSAAMEERKRLENVQTKTLFSILQSEMSPHFLYNTLGSIANMCESGENEGAADACYSLTEILRYSSNYATSEVTVREEIDNLKAYLSVMKSRYRNRLHYEIHHDASSDLLILPKLTYQPIVENAIKYSLMEQETVVINIYTILFAGMLFIEVKDNGCGISDEAISRIGQRIDQFRKGPVVSEISDQIQFGGMGLSGTLIRLSIIFGDNFSYHLLPDNDEGGSTVVLCIHTD